MVFKWAGRESFVKDRVGGLSCHEVRCRKEAHARGYDSKAGENDEAHAVNHHGSKLPLRDDFLGLVFFLHAIRDEAKFLDDGVQLSVSCEAGVHGCRVFCVDVQERRGVVLLPEIVIDVKDVGQETPRGSLLEFELFHFVVDEDAFPSKLSTRSLHSEEPRQPNEKN